MDKEEIFQVEEHFEKYLNRIKQYSNQIGVIEELEKNLNTSTKRKWRFKEKARGLWKKTSKNQKWRRRHQPIKIRSEIL